MNGQTDLGTDRQTDNGQTDRHKNEQSYGQTDGQTDEMTYRQTNGQTDRQMYKHMNIYVYNSMHIFGH